MTWIIKRRFPIVAAIIIILASVVSVTLILKKNASDSSSESKGRVVNINSITPMNKDTSKDNILSPENKFKLPEEAFELHYDAVVVDSHNDFLYQIVKRNADFAKENTFTQTGLPRLIKGGVRVQFFALWIPPENFADSKEYVLNEINILNSLAKNNSAQFEIAKSFKDVENILKQNKLAGLIGIEGGTAIENNIDNLDEFYSLGVRYISLTWNNSNNIASSAADEEMGKVTGLTDFGKKVIQRMNSLGILVDVSHLGEKSFWDVAAISDKPLIASHSCSYTLNPVKRNLTDEQIKAIAKSGGVVMINFHSTFLKKDAKKKISLANKVYSKELKSIFNKYGDDLIKYNEERYNFLQTNRPSENTATLDDLIEQIEYIIKLVGVEYVGLGSDYDGGIQPPFDLYDGTCYPMITKRLAEKGYSELEIRNILGLNFLRVFKSL